MAEKVRLSVVIPVFNEHGTIREIIDRVDRVDCPKELIIVDDASTDGTREMLAGLKKKGTKVLLHQHNQGKGAAIRTGIGEATGEYLIIQDADLEYDPQDYLKLIEAAEKCDSGVVYGSRFKLGRSGKPLVWYMANRFLTGITNLLFGASLTDMETCYKLIKTDLTKSLDLKADRFEFEPEVTAKLLKKGLKITEVPISYHGRERREGKKITWKDGFSAIWFLIKYRFTD